MDFKELGPISNGPLFQFANLLHGKLEVVEVSFGTRNVATSWGPCAGAHRLVVMG